MLDGRRIIFIQPYVPAYREPFFSGMRQRLAERGAELVVAVDTLRTARSDHQVDQVDLVLGSRLSGHVRLRPRGPLSLRRSDLVVMEQALRNLETPLLLATRRDRRPGYALWGHGRASTQSGALDRVKQAMTRRADWFFAYTHQGAEWVAEHGFSKGRITVVRNTIDGVTLGRDLTEASVDDLREFSQRHHLSTKRNALFLGSVDRAKDLGYLLKVARALSAQDSEATIAVGGDGPDLEFLRRAASAVGCLRILGRIDGKGKALALHTAKALVIPQGVGLVAVDAEIAGLPILTRADRGHGPEIGYLGEDRCVTVPSDAAPEEYARQLGILLSRRVENLAAGAYERRGATWSVQGMVDRFVQGVAQWASS